jgi:hypothetical protein
MLFISVFPLTNLYQFSKIPSLLSICTSLNIFQLYTFAAGVFEFLIELNNGPLRAIFF